MSNSLPSNWTIKPLEEVCTWIGVGIATSTTHAYTTSGVPILRNQNILPNSIRDSDMLHITEEFSNKNDSKKLRTGDVISIRTGYPGVSAVVPEKYDGCHSFTTLISRPNSVVISSFYLSFLINSDYGRSFVLGGQAGGAQQNLNASVLKQFPVILPPLPEQQKIATILTSVDEVIEKTQAQIDKLKDLKTGMMQTLLSPTEDSLQRNGGVGIREGAQDLSKSYKPHTEFKDSPVGRIPKSWEVVNLGLISSLITKGATPTTSGHSYALEGTRFYRSVNASENGELQLDDVRFISSEADKQLKRSSLAKGDVVLSIVGAKTGKTYFFIDEKSPLPANINQNIALIRPSRIRLYPEFLKFFISSNAFLQQVEREITTQAQPSLSLKQVGDFIIQLPSLDEQMEITKYMSSIVSCINAKNKQLVKVRGIKKALMQDLLTGKVRVKLDSFNTLNATGLQASS